MISNELRVTNDVAVSRLIITMSVMSSMFNSPFVSVYSYYTLKR